MMLVVGDSKTDSQDWHRQLRVNLNATGITPHILSVYDRGVAFQTVATAVTVTIPAINAVTTNSPMRYILMNWGVNEMSNWGAVVEATWKANYLSIIDAAHARFPVATIWLMRPWARNNEAHAATLKGWIDDIIAARSEYVFAGPDESVWLKGGDDGATNSTDGVHYSTAGQAACAAAYQSTMGF